MTKSPSFRIYLRDPQQRVSDKTVTQDKDVALVAFAGLVNREDLDGKDLLAVCNFDGKPVAHHSFLKIDDGSNSWRGRLEEIKWPNSLS